MSDVEGHCRTTRLLLPDLLDDDVTEEKPAHFSDVYVESLDRASRGFARAQTALTER
jgi:hypothetical protein